MSDLIFTRQQIEETFPGAFRDGEGTLAFVMREAKALSPVAAFNAASGVPALHHLKEKTVSMDNLLQISLWERAMYRPFDDRNHAGVVGALQFYKQDGDVYALKKTLCGYSRGGGHTELEKVFNFMAQADSRMRAFLCRESASTNRLRLGDSWTVRNNGTGIILGALAVECGLPRVTR